MEGSFSGLKGFVVSPKDHQTWSNLKVQNATSIHFHQVQDGARTYADASKEGGETVAEVCQSWPAWVWYEQSIASWL